MVTRMYAKCGSLRLRNNLIHNPSREGRYLVDFLLLAQGQQLNVQSHLHNSCFGKGSHFGNFIFTFEQLQFQCLNGL